MTAFDDVPHAYVAMAKREYKRDSATAAEFAWRMCEGAALIAEDEGYPNGMDSPIAKKWSRVAAYLRLADV